MFITVYSMVLVVRVKVGADDVNSERSWPYV